MTIDSNNLSTWLAAGYTQVGGSQPTAPAPAPTPQPAQQPQQQQYQQPVQQPTYNSPTPANAGNIDLGKYGISNPDGVSSQQLSQLAQDYDDLMPITVVQNGVYKTIGYQGTPIPKATVVSPSGERVTVRTDNKTGKYRTLAEMQQSGYKIESAPGVSADKTTVAGGAQALDQRPALKLKDGSIVNSTDPNYDKYKNVAGVTPIDNKQKQILNDNGKLYAWDGRQATYIPDQNTLSKYVSQGYADTRANYQGVTGQAGAMVNAPGTVNTPGSSPQPLPGQSVSTNIPFKASLSQDQKQSINQLVQNKPDPNTWSALDKQNWSYATNNAPLPSASAGVPGGQADYSGQGGQNAAASGQNAGGFNVDPVDRTWINQLYQKYFDRDATTAEMSNWSKENPQALEQFLGMEAKKYGYSSKYFKDSDEQRLKSALDMIENSNLPPELKQLWAATVKGYPSGVEYNSQEVLNTFNKIKQDTIDPYFKELATIASTDFSRALQQQKSEYELTQEKLRADAGQSIRQVKEGFEQSGMTFTGKAIQELGAQSAYSQNGGNGTQIPTQQPTDGMFYEGNVNQQNRLMATSASLQNKATIDALNRSLEKTVGSEKAAGAGATVSGGITGELATQQQGQYAKTLSQVLDNYRQKQQLNTNIQY